MNRRKWLIGIVVFTIGMGVCVVEAREARTRRETAAPTPAGGLWSRMKARLFGRKKSPDTPEPKKVSGVQRLFGRPPTRHTRRATTVPASSVSEPTIPVVPPMAEGPAKPALSEVTKELFAAVESGDWYGKVLHLVDPMIRGQQEYPDMNAVNEEGYTPMTLAVSKGDRSMVEELENYNPNSCNKHDGKGRLPLMMAVERQDESVVRGLLERAKARANQRDKNEMTPLMKAADLGFDAAVEALLEAGADPDLRNERDYGWTALFYAAEKKNAGSVRLLLDHGADMRLRDNGWNSAVDIADIGRDSTRKFVNIFRNHARSLELVELFDKFGDGDVEQDQLKLQIKAKLRVPGLNLNLVRKGKDLPLRIAFEHGDLGLARKLLDYGARVDLVEKQDPRFSMLHYALGHNDHELFDMLLKAGADKRRTLDGKTLEQRLYELHNEAHDAGDMKYANSLHNIASMLGIPRDRFVGRQDERRLQREVPPPPFRRPQLLFQPEREGSPVQAGAAAEAQPLAVDPAKVSQLNRLEKKLRKTQARLARHRAEEAAGTLNPNVKIGKVDKQVKSLERSVAKLRGEIAQQAQ